MMNESYQQLSIANEQTIEVISKESIQHYLKLRNLIKEFVRKKAIGNKIVLEVGIGYIQESFNSIIDFPMFLFDKNEKMSSYNLTLEAFVENAFVEGLNLQEIKEELSEVHKKLYLLLKNTVLYKKEKHLFVSSSRYEKGVLEFNNFQRIHIVEYATYYLKQIETGISNEQEFLQIEYKEVFDSNIFLVLNILQLQDEKAKEKFMKITSLCFPHVSKKIMEEYYRQNAFSIKKDEKK